MKKSIIPLFRYSIIPLFRYCILLASVGCSSNEQSQIIDSSIIDRYVEQFNQSDEELYIQTFPNAQAAGFLKENIPLFECPDKTLEEIYYFRWWTYRKHVKQTPEGYIITEFLPDVSWAGKYNGISCPAMLHYDEGRWLRNQTYLDDYANYWLRGGGSPRSYSFPIAHALYGYYLVTGNDSLVRELLPDLMLNYGEWEKERFDESRGLFWQIDDRDGMEWSICGSGFRATINSYMAAEARAIASIGHMMRDNRAEKYGEKSASILKNMLQLLWDREAGFFKVLSREENATLCDARELHGYTPWAFDLVGPEYAGAWKFIMDTTYFYAPYGPTTAERCHPGFSISYEGRKACKWNGPSWPLATSITLTGLANLLNNQEQNYITNEDYFDLLRIYTKCHYRTKEDGTVVPWIDELINPFNGDWIARTMYKNWGWSYTPKERGKDYNHSSFCDLVISGLIGIRPQEGNILVVHPLLPDGKWDYFCLENVPYHGKNITVLYDKTGAKYRKGKGLIVFVNGKKVASSQGLSALKCEMMAKI